MKKRKIIRGIVWLLNILLIFLLIWSLINYKILNQDISKIVQALGLVGLVVFVILLEGAPVFIGPSVIVASALTLNSHNPWLIFGLFLVSAILGNVFYYYLGYFSGEKILKYFNKKDVKRYEDNFEKYGRIALLIMAISPIPYLPTLAGVFREKSLKFIIGTLALRLIRHTVVFSFWFLVIAGI